MDATTKALRRFQPRRNVLQKLFARITFSVVEGIAHVFSDVGTQRVLALIGVCVLTKCGVAWTVKTSGACVLAIFAGRAAQVLVKVHLPAGDQDGSNDALQTVFHYKPELELTATSGVWDLLCDAILVCQRIVADTQSMIRGPDITRLQQMPVQELLLRLAVVWDRHQRREGCVHATDVQGQPVTADLKDRFCYYIKYATASYLQTQTEEQLEEWLMEADGWSLVAVRRQPKPQRPAHYVAVHGDRREMLVAVRGTEDIQDMITDVLWCPQEFADTGYKCHQGIKQSSEWLAHRLLPMLLPMAKAGYRTTLVGHSLGAGAAALLAVLLKSKGIDDVVCYGYAMPACAPANLCDDCSSYVYSIVNNDDVVPRLHPEAFLQVAKELCSVTSDELKDKAQMFGIFKNWLLDSIAGSVEAASQAAEEVQNANGTEDADGLTADTCQSDLAELMPYVPGTIVYIQGLPQADEAAQEAAHEAGHESSSADSLAKTAAASVLAFLPNETKQGDDFTPLFLRKHASMDLEWKSTTADNSTWRAMSVDNNVFKTWTNDFNANNTKKEGSGSLPSVVEDGDGDSVQLFIVNRDLLQLRQFVLSSNMVLHHYLEPDKGGYAAILKSS